MLYRLSYGLPAPKRESPVGYVKARAHASGPLARGPAEPDADQASGSAKSTKAPATAWILAQMNADFADCVIIERSAHHALCTHTVTLDEKAAKTAGMVLLD